MNNKNTVVKEKKSGNTTFIVERHFGDLDLMDLYTDYAVDKIVETEKQSTASDNASKRIEI